MYFSCVCFAAVLLWYTTLFAESSIFEAIPYSTQCSTPTTESMSSCIYDFTVKDLNGNDVCLRKFEGNVVIIVNYASTCAFTYVNVMGLSDLAKKYESRGLVIILFPCNDFFENLGGNSDDQKFANEHPEFVVFKQISVNGQEEHRLYTYLKKAQSGLIVSSIEWNFTKFLVNKFGQAVKRFLPSDSFKDLEKEVLILLD